MFRQAGGRIRLPLSALHQSRLPAPEKEQHLFNEFIRRLAAVLESSPTGCALLQSSAAQHTSVGLDPLLEPSSSFFYPAQNHFDFGYQPEILRDTEKGQGRYLVSFISGLRRAWHRLNGSGADMSLKPENFLRQFRCEAADIEAVTQLIGWELRAAGHFFLWRHLLAGMNGDLSALFEQSVAENPHAQFDGHALRSVFNQWFTDQDRVDACDTLGLEMIDMLWLQKKQDVPAVSQPGQRLGRLPGGSDYLAGCDFDSARYDGLGAPSNRLYLNALERERAAAALLPPLLIDII